MQFLWLGVPGGGDPMRERRVRAALAFAAHYGADGERRTHWGDPEVDGLISAMCVLAHEVERMELDS